MKFMLYISLLCTLFMSSCSKPAVEVNLTVSPQYINIGPEGSTQKITINSNVEWSSKLNGSWCTVQPSAGNAGQTDMMVYIPKNTSANERTAVITVSADNKALQINVKQTGQLSFNIPTNNYTIDHNGGNVLVNTPANKDYEVTIPTDASWITSAGTSGSLQLNIEVNNSGEDRLAKIIFKDKNSSTEHTTLIIQKTNNPNGQLLMLRELKINGVPCIRDEGTEKKEFYFPVDMDINPNNRTVKIEFTGNGVEYIKFEGDNDTKVFSGDNYTFKTLSANSRIRISSHNALTDQTGTPRLNITGLPLVSIVAPEEILDDPKRPCDITIIDPKGRTEGNLVYYTSFAGIELRGSGALRYPKKAFGFKLRDRQTNQAVDAKLLGLRNDNDWILDAMWLDNAKMRNRVCFDLWNEFNKLYYTDQEPKAKSGTHGHMVEVFLNGSYHGLYCLSDKLDRKQLNLKKEGGYLYKTTDWTSEATLSGITTAYNNNFELWNGISMEYPTDPGTIEFKHYADLVKFVSGTSKEEFSAKFEERIDVNNAVDVFLFTNLIVAWDNIGRNLYWAIYDINQSNKMVPLMWDMDGTLGRAWDQWEEDPNCGFLINNRHFGTDFRLFKRMVDENPANVKAKIKARWTELRNGVLSPANLAAKLDYYAAQQINSGARDREVARWRNVQSEIPPNNNYNDITAEVTYIKSWYAKRLAKMDILISTL